MESALRGSPDLTDPALRLIETMLWNGVAFPRWPLHMARMARSAAVFGWPFDTAQAALVSRGPLGAAPARLRLTLDAGGTLRAEAAPLPPAKADWRVGLAPGRLSSCDPWLRHKTTRRAIYDAARAALPEGLDEVLFLNERGEVCDGTITTVFFDRGQGMRTPPLACGLLPGVLRAELSCPEEVLRADDLPRVRLWVGNALRGLSPAVWAQP